MAISFVASAIGQSNSTTSFSITLPTTQAGDIIILEFAHRGTGDGTIAGTYNGPAFALKHSQLFATSLYSGKTYWSRATGDHSGQTVTGSSLTNSCAAIVTVYRGALASGDPLADATIVGEQNASGDETQAQITTMTDGAWVVLMVVNSPDYAVSTQACTSPGALTEQAERLSTGGTDSSVSHASAEKTSAGATGAFTWAQTNAVSGSWAYAIKPGVVPVELTNVGAIASAVAFGTHLLGVTLLTTGIISATVFGTAAVVPYNPPVELTTVGNIGTGEAYGTQGLSLTTAPVGITSSGAYGTQGLSLALADAGAIVTGEIFGTASISGAPVELTGVGDIATAEAHGTQVLAVDISSSGIISGETHGAQNLALLIVPVGVVSVETIGQPAASVIMVPLGIASAEDIGWPIVQGEGGPIELTSVGGVPSAEAFGQPSLGVFLGPTGIVSDETIGSPGVIADLTATGIGSAEATGLPILNLEIAASGLQSAEVFGTADVFPVTDYELVVIGIESAELFGVPRIRPYVKFISKDTAQRFMIRSPIPTKALLGFSTRPAIPRRGLKFH